MSNRSEFLIDQLLLEREAGDLESDPAAVARGLRLLNLSTTEAGWILRHLFGLAMPDAVHLAKLSEPGAKITVRTTVEVLEPWE